MNEIKAQELFDFFTKEGYDLGSFDNFTSSLQDESKRNELHSFLVNEGYDVGKSEDFVLKKKRRNRYGIYFRGWFFGLCRR